MKLHPTIIALAIIFLVLSYTALTLSEPINGDAQAISLRIVEKTGDTEREYVYIISRYPLEKVTLEAEKEFLTVKQEDVVILRIPLKSSYYTLIYGGNVYRKEDDKITVEIELEESQEILVKVVYDMATLTVDPGFKNVKVHINGLPRRSLKVLKGRKSCWSIDRGSMLVGSGLFATELVAEKTSDCLLVEEDTLVKIEWKESTYARSLKYGLLILFLVALGEFAIILYIGKFRRKASYKRA